MPADVEFSGLEAMLFVVLAGMRLPLVPAVTLYQAGDPASRAAGRAGGDLLPLAAARSGSLVSGAGRLTSLSGTALRELPGGSRDDAVAAVREWVRRGEGAALGWTRLAGSHVLGGGRVVNMAAGEGKSWLFPGGAVRRAVRPGTGAVHVITTRGDLADRGFERYHALGRRSGRVT